MLAEGAHSIADTVNQGFLLVSLRTGARPADEEHPFGHGQERYFWSLLAAVGIFVAGAGFSIFEGILSIVTGRHSGGLLIAYIVLGRVPDRRGHLADQGRRASCTARPGTGDDSCSTTSSAAGTPRSRPPCSRTPRPSWACC